LGQSQYDVIADEIDVKVRNTEENGQPQSYAAAVASNPDDDEEGDSTALQENIEVDETIVLEKKSPNLWKTLLTGLPSPSSRFLSIATFLINLGLVLAATDLIYRAKVQYPSHDLSFARIGYVSDSEAKLLVREPNHANLPIYVSLRSIDSETGQPDSGWRSFGPITNLSNDTDFTSTISIPLPRTPGRAKYQYMTSNNHGGFITSAPKTGYTNEPDGKFTFLTSSCIIPRFPYNPFKHPLSIPGFKHLAKVIPSLDPQFMLFLGDFIYIDVPKRFGYDVEDYRRGYRQVYSSPDYPAVAQNLSWIHVIDDHEITNDFDLNTEDQESSIYQTAIEPWNDYQGAANPPVARKSSIYSKGRTDATYFEFTQGPASFFMMDTRRYRDLNGGLAANDTEKSMLGNEQLQDLLAFLAKPVPRGVRWKFVISSVPFTKNWKVNNLDTWAGFLDERQKILEAMWDVGLKGGVGVVVLSGDRHEFASTAFPPPLGGKWPISATVHEFSTSPLSQFYLPIPSYRQTDDDDVLVK
jgi:alkaline phosphatase D